MKMRFVIIQAIIVVSTFWGLKAAAYNDLHLQESMNPRKEPDVVADTITRTSRPGPIPVLLIVRHSDKFPAILEKVTISAEFDDGRPALEKIVEYNLKLKRPWWSDVQNVEIPESYKGKILINVRFEMNIKGKERSIKNNNARDSRHLPLEIFAGAPPLPRYDDWYAGDPHFHTYFSDNAVEFGAPIDVSADMAGRLGLDWLVFTDHSFDLDDTEGDSTKNDPLLPRWNRYLTEVAAAKKAHPEMALLTGEELSCGNSKGQNVHMLVINNSEFYVGNGDGFESKNSPDRSCSDVAASAPGTVLTFSAHPRCELSPVELYVINRGNWEQPDMDMPGLTGHEAWNHAFAPYPEGLEWWKKLLESGSRKFLLAGSDSHGDFNREYSGWPYAPSFGAPRTLVYVEGGLSSEKLLDGLKKGRIVTTSGPAAMLEIVNSDGDSTIIGGETAGGPFMAVAGARSSAEFGPISEIKIYAGNLDTKSETLLTTYSSEYSADPFDVDNTLRLPDDLKNGYVRIEATSKSGDQTFYAYTNPIWFRWNK